jgi:hypothetical protein
MNYFDLSSVSSHSLVFLPHSASWMVPGHPRRDNMMQAQDNESLRLHLEKMSQDWLPIRNFHI